MMLFSSIYMNCWREVEFTSKYRRALNTTDLLRNKRVSNKIAPAGPPKFKVIRIPKWETN
jgi:hypothetical protein